MCMPKVPWQVRAFTHDLLTNTADFALFLIAFGVGVMVGGRNTMAVHKAAYFAQDLTVDSIARAIRLSREKGWIKRDLNMTREGQKRVRAMFPQPRNYPKRWDNTWHLISFDIPRTLNHARNRLRDVLRRVGFGKLHDSLWICSQDFLGDVLEYAATEKIGDYLIPAISSEVGRARSRELADQVWKLKELDYRYLMFINALAQGKPASPELFLEYISIVRDDPFLPVPLLPEGWYGVEAHALARKHFSQVLREQKNW